MTKVEGSRVGGRAVNTLWKCEWFGLNHRRTRPILVLYILHIHIYIYDCVELFTWVKDMDTNATPSETNPYLASRVKLYLTAAGIRTRDLRFTSPYI